MKLAINTVSNCLTIEDVNKTDNDTIWTSIKKLWAILICIAFCGASIGICLVTAPLNI